MEILLNGDYVWTKSFFGPYDMVHMMWSIWYCPYYMVYMIWTISFGESNMEPCFETMSIWISLCLYYKNSNSDFYKFLWFFWFVMFSTIQWWGMKKCIWSRVPEIFPLPKLTDRDFLYIYSSLKVKNLYKFLIGSTTYWKIQYFLFGIVSQCVGR